MGRWRVNPGIFKRIWLIWLNDFKALLSGQWRALKPLYVDRFILLLGTFFMLDMIKNRRF